MHFIASIALAIGCGLLPWTATRLPARWAAIAATPFLAFMVAGTIFGLPLYPFSDAIVFVFSTLAGIVLGRAMPPRFRPFLLLLLLLSALDLAQNVVLSGPSPTSSSSSTAPDPHLIWLNFRIQLQGGHLNVGFADIILIAAVSEHLRRRLAPMQIAVLPGVIGLGLGEALAVSLPQPAPGLLAAFEQSLIPLLTAGFVLTELAASQVSGSTAQPNR